jgi:hypothetical protein
MNGSVLPSEIDFGDVEDSNEITVYAKQDSEYYIGEVQATFTPTFLTEPFDDVFAVTPAPTLKGGYIKYQTNSTTITSLDTSKVILNGANIALSFKETAFDELPIVSLSNGFFSNDANHNVTFSSLTLPTTLTSLGENFMEGNLSPSLNFSTLTSVTALPNGFL